MSAFMIDSSPLTLTPTPDNYSRGYVPLGKHERSLDGTLISLTGGVKKKWVLRIQAGDDLAWLEPYFDGREFAWTDCDGEEYVAKITGGCDVSGYPVEDRGEWSITIEEV
jgi:hypothetical protein